MGLDVGSRTIGVALSDETMVVASALTTVRRQGTASDVETLLELIREHEVSTVVFGLPLELDGKEGKRAGRVKLLAEALKEKWSGPTEMWDERLTTVQANRVLLQADLSRKKRRRVVDKVAATLILQGYLDARKQNPP